MVMPTIHDYNLMKRLPVSMEEVWVGYSTGIIAYGAKRRFWNITEGVVTKSSLTDRLIRQVELERSKRKEDRKAAYKILRKVSGLKNFVENAVVECVELNRHYNFNVKLRFKHSTLRWCGSNWRGSEHGGMILKYKDRSYMAKCSRRTKMIVLSKPLIKRKMVELELKK